MSLSGNLPGVVAAGGILFLIVTWLRARYDCGNTSVQRSSHRYPPGPPAHFILGHRLPKKNPFLTVGSWIEQYGPLISLRVGTNRYVVIGRHKAAMDIMEKRGAVMADRPRMMACGELLSRGLRMIVTPAGERLKRMRRAFHTHFQPKAAKTYEPLQMSHAKGVVLGLLENSEQYQNHIRAYAASVALKLSYGKNTPTHASDPDVLAIQKTVDRFLGAMRPGAYLVDNFPWLKYVPWYGRELRQGFIEDYALYRRQMDTTRRSVNDPGSGPSFAKFLLTQGTDFDLTEHETVFLAGVVFGAGSDTTALAICNAMMCAARHRKAQAAVHAELDAVVGRDQLPTFDNEESLPVLRAFILEMMRWRPLVPSGVPHRAMEDIVWGDYCIPAGTTVIGNHWAISRDPEVFPDPDTFDLTRWLTTDGELRDDLRLPYFGFGRRVCPGQHVATRSIFINTLFVLWSFRLSFDESEPADDMAFMSGIMCKPIGLHFEPRMAKEKLKAIMEQ